MSENLVCCLCKLPNSQRNLHLLKNYKKLFELLKRKLVDLTEYDFLCQTCSSSLKRKYSSTVKKVQTDSLSTNATTSYPSSLESQSSVNTSSSSNATTIMKRRLPTANTLTGEIAIDKGSHLIPDSAPMQPPTNAKPVNPSVSNTSAKKPSLPSTSTKQVAETVPSTSAKQVAPSATSTGANRVAPSAPSTSSKRVKPSVPSTIAKRVKPSVPSTSAKQLAPSATSTGANRMAPSAPSTSSKRVKPSVPSTIAKLVKPSVPSTSAKQVAPSAPSTSSNTSRNQVAAAQQAEVNIISPSRNNYDRFMPHSEDEMDDIPDVQSLEPPDSIVHVTPRLPYRRQGGDISRDSIIAGYVANISGG